MGKHRKRKPVPPQAGLQHMRSFPMTEAVVRLVDIGDGGGSDGSEQLAWQTDQGMGWEAIKSNLHGRIAI